MRLESLHTVRIYNLGHTDAGTTLIYAERDRRKAIEIARRVG